MGIFKTFLGNTYIKGETMLPKLRVGLNNIKLFLGSNLRYQMPISGATATCSTATYNGSKQTAQNISVSLSSQTLTNNTDYTVTSNNGGTNAGSYTFTVSGINYFNSSVNGTFKINPKTVSSPTITLNPSSYTYNGNAQSVTTVTVKDGSTTIASSEYTISYSNNTNVGTATCTITDKSGGNYTVNGSKTFTIVKYTPTVTLAATNRAYNGNPLYATATVSKPTNGKTIKGTIYYGTTSGATTYSIAYGGSGSVNLSSVSVTNVGSATVYAYFVPDSTCNDAYNNSGNASKTFTVSKADQSAPTASGATTTYHNTATATASGGGGQGTLTWTNGSTRTATGTTKTKAYWAGNSNYNASPESNEVSLVVNKATDQSITVTLTNRTFNGSGQVVASATSHGCTYYLGFGSSSTSAPTSWGSANSSISQTNAGTYYVWYKGTADANHSADISATYKGTVTVAKRQVTCTAPTKKTLTWNGSDQTLATAGSVTSGTMSYCSTSGGTYSSTIPTGKAAGNYTVWYKSNPDSNHSGTCSGSTACSIAKKTGCAISFGTTTVSKTYGNAAFTNAITNSGDGSLTWGSSNTGVATVNSNGQVTIKAAGSCTISATTTSTTNCTYSTTAASYTLNVAKAACCSTAPTTKSLTWNGSNQALVNAGSSSCGTMKYCSTATGTYTTTIPTGKAATNYTTYWKVDNDANHSGTCSGSVATTIAKKTGCTISFATTSISKTYGNAAFTNAITNSGDGSLTWGSSNTGVATVNSSGQVTIKAAGSCTISATTTSTTNCTYSTTAASYSLSIAKAAMTYTAPKAAVRTYNGSAQQIVSGQSAAGGSIQFCSTSGGTYSTTVPTQTNAGTSYSTWWKAVPDGNHSGGTSAAQITNCKINKAPCCSTAPKATTYAYNGSARNLVSGGSSSCGTMQYCTTATGTYTSDIPQQTNAGTYTTYWKVANDSNHSGTCSGSVSTTIAKAAMSYCTPKVAVRTYNGASQQIVSGTCTTTGGSVYYATSNAGASSSTTIPTATNVGTWTRYWKAIPDSNHSGGTDSWAALSNCKINQKALTITAKAQTITWGGSITQGTGQTTTSGLVDGDALTTITLTPSTTAVTTTGTITPSAGATTKGISNYSVTYSNGTLTINKKTGCAISFATTAITKTYGNAAFTNAATNNGDSTITWSSSNTGVCTVNSSGQVTIKAAGSCTITATVANTSNCTYSTTAATYTITVNKASLTITAKAQTVNYGTAITQGTGQTTTSGLVSGDALTAITLTQSTTNVPGGVITPSAGATTKGIGNYSVTYKTGTLTINKVAMTSCTPTAKSGLVYSGSAQVLVNDCAPTGGDIQYSGGSNSSYSTTVPKGTNAGSYTINWKNVPDSNHSGGTTGSATVSIAKSATSISYATTAVTKTYGDAAFTHTLTNPSNAPLTSCTSFDTSVATVDSTGKVTIVGAGKTGIRVQTDSETTNYSINPRTATYELTVKKASLTITAKAQTVTWGTAITQGTGQTTTSGLVSGDALTAITLTQSTTNVPGGTITPSAGATTKGISNYSVTYKTGTLTINKAAMTSCTPTAKSGLVYNTSAQTLMTDCIPGWGDIQYSGGSNSSYSTTVPKGTNAGSYTINWKNVPDSNHSGGTTGSATVSIAKASQSAPTATGATVCYGNTATASASGGGGKGSLQWSNGNSRTAVGSQTTKARWSGNSNYNASSYSSEVTLKVNATWCSGTTWLGTLTWPSA